MTFRPVTQLGTVAVSLAVAHVLLMLGWRLLGPLGGFPGLAAGLAAGIVALVAITRRHERAWSVLASTLPLVLVVSFVVLELALGHD